MNALEKAKTAWGADMPDWVQALAQATEASSQRVVARRLGLSQTAIALVLSNSYGASTREVEAKVLAVYPPGPSLAMVIGWGNAPPDWIAALSAACEAAPQAEVGRRIEYSAAVVSQVLRNTYKGNLKRVEYRVRGRLMRQTIDCPVLSCADYTDMSEKVRAFGHIGHDVCAWHQERHFDKARFTRGVSEAFKATCPTCPHWLKTKGK